MRFSTLLFLFIFSLNSGASETIKLVVNNWTSQIVLSHVTAILLEKQGHTVELVESSVSDQ